MRILLIQPLGGLVDPGALVRSCFLEPIGMQYVASAAENSGYQVRCEHPVRSDDEFMKIVKDYLPQVIGYSVYSYAVEQAKRWARMAKALLPLSINVFGGYHPSAEPCRVVADPNVDYAIVGEGELAFVKLLDEIALGNTSPYFSGVAYGNEKGEFVIAVPKRIKRLDSLPKPIRIFSLLSKSKSYQIMYPPPSKQRAVAQVAYSRGCPHACDFCASSTIWGRAVYWRSPEKVVDEIESLAAEFGTNLVFFSDVNMATSSRKLEQICLELIDRDLPVYWWTMCRIDELTPDLIKLMIAAKAVKITVGIEAGEETLFQKMKKSKLSWENTCRVLNIAHDHGLITRGTLMLDLPGLKRTYYRHFASFLQTLPLDEIRFSFCTPFPGTKFGIEYFGTSDRLEKGLSNLTTEVPVYCSDGMSKEELLDLRCKLISVFYGSSSYMERLRNKMTNFPHLSQSFHEFFDFARNHSFLDSAIVHDLYEVIDGAAGTAMAEV